VVGAQSASRAGEWETVPAPDLGEYGGEITGLAIVSPDDVWAVGTSEEYLDDGGYLTHIAVRHWDGKRWHTVPTPNGSPHLRYGAYLRGVEAIDSDDVWAVGAYAEHEVGWQPLALHWNGTAWHIIPTPKLVPQPGSGLFSELTEIAVVSANDVWAVGYRGEQTLTMHWDGVAWRILPSPNTERGNGVLLGVAAVSADDVWAVGNGRDTPQAEFLLLHWDGVAWTVVEPPPYRKTGWDFLNAVAAVSANDVWAVGYSGTHLSEADAVTMHWDGMAWTVVPSIAGAGTLWDVAAAPDGRVWAVGDISGRGLRENRSLITRWGGDRWLQMESPNPGNYWNRFRSVAVSGSEVWAVGSYSGTEGGGTMILHSRGADNIRLGMPRTGANSSGPDGLLLSAMYVAVLLILSGLVLRATMAATRDIWGLR